MIVSRRGDGKQETESIFFSVTVSPELRHTRVTDQQQLDEKVVMRRNHDESGISVTMLDWRCGSGLGEDLVGRAAWNEGLKQV